MRTGTNQEQPGLIELLRMVPALPSQLHREPGTLARLLSLSVIVQKNGGTVNRHLSEMGEMCDSQ